MFWGHGFGVDQRKQWGFKRDCRGRGRVVPNKERQARRLRHGYGLAWDREWERGGDWGLIGERSQRRGSYYSWWQWRWARRWINFSLGSAMGSLHLFLFLAFCVCVRTHVCSLWMFFGFVWIWKFSLDWLAQEWSYQEENVFLNQNFTIFTNLLLDYISLVLYI